MLCICRDRFSVVCVLYGRFFARVSAVYVTNVLYVVYMLYYSNCIVKNEEKCCIYVKW